MWLRNAALALLLLCGSTEAARLVWDPNPAGEQVTGYRVHHGATSRQYSTTVDVGLATEWELPAGVGPYLAVTAYSAAGESGYSAEVVWTPQTGPPAAATDVRVAWREEAAVMATWGPTAISAAADDGQEYGSDWTTYFSGASPAASLFGDDSFGSRLNVGLRWSSVAVPQGATITSATLTYTKNAGGSPADIAGTPTCRVTAVASDSAAQWSSSIRPSNTSKTTAYTDHTGTSGSGTASINVTSIVQEVVNRAGWASGNAMAFNLVGTSALAGNMRGLYDSSTANPPTLEVVYTAGGGSTAIPVFMAQYRQRVR